ncbi:hypothetical protein ICC18_12115 [Paenibacillus sp. WST5]|uniref:CHASE4 domain-containing protein n=1 Tax=Paenibacillus sedimenti TaxID=2770274 RepID=A0A926KPN8_9BACL|nr:hypothetical protein [Paenibacillus sedimenti]
MIRLRYGTFLEGIVIWSVEETFNGGIILKLQKKLFTYLGIMIIVSISLVYVLLYKYLLGSYADLDQQDARSEMQDILYTVSEELDTLRNYVLNYSARDETYFFIDESDITDDHPFIQSNFPDSTYTANRFQLVLITNAEGKVVYAHGYDLQQN